jgi:signal transduction histidine kinase/ActR/RegA family two-component response regulator
MRSLADLSVGQRLAGGFVVVMLLFAAFAAVSLGYQREAEEAQARLTQAIIPRAQAAEELERSIFRVAIQLRNFLMMRDAERSALLKASVDQARAAQAALATMPKEADGAALFRVASSAVDVYLGKVLGVRQNVADVAELERDLHNAREVAYLAVLEYGNLQRVKAREAIAAMESSRGDVSEALLATLALVAAALAALSFAITWSIRRPARELVGIARELREGHWKPALALHVPGAPEPRDELAAIARAFGAAASGLEQREQQLQAQNEELQAQNEEIQAQNEEIQAQSEELQAQNEEIQSQGEELQAQNDELAERTAELELADARKNQFLGLLAHELRNPLGAIANSLFVLDRGSTRTPQEARTIAVIQRQMKYLTRLIDDLLDATRIAHGKLHLQREPIDFAQLVHDGVHDAQVAADTAGVTLRAQLPTEPVAVHGDRTRLAQVLGNLVSNALKFTPSGGRVDVEMTADAARVELRVRDTGPGIAPELRERLFQPFSQGDTGLVRPNGGLGLGLSIARALVKMHDGTIGMVDTAPGTGSEFVVTLPLANLPANVATEAAPAASGRPRLRILLVEDNVDAAETMRMALELEGQDVTVARSGPEGIERAIALVPDIVLCDIGIPGCDGYEVARRLREESSLDATRLVALSGYATALDRQRTADAGFDDHLAKPVSIDRLLDVLAATPARAGVRPRPESRV